MNVSYSICLVHTSLGPFSKEESFVKGCLGTKGVRGMCEREAMVGSFIL